MDPFSLSPALNAYMKRDCRVLDSISTTAKPAQLFTPLGRSVPGVIKLSYVSSRTGKVLINKHNGFPEALHGLGSVPQDCWIGKILAFRIKVLVDSER